MRTAQRLSLTILFPQGLLERVFCDVVFDLDDCNALDVHYDHGVRDDCKVYDDCNAHDDSDLCDIYDVCNIRSVLCLLKGQ